MIYVQTGRAEPPALFPSFSIPRKRTDLVAKITNQSQLLAFWIDGSIWLAVKGFMACTIPE